MSAAALGQTTARPGRPGILRRAHRRLGLLGMVAAAWLIVVVLAAVFAPLVAPYAPNAENLLASYAGPSASHLLGTDQLGRDLLSRLIWGARSSLLGPLIVVAFAVGFGTPLAVASAWRGGRVDFAIGRLLDLLFAFPGLILAIMVVALYGPGLLPCGIALGIAYTPWQARVTRSAALRERSRPYIDAAQVRGFSSVAICLRHLIPNIAPIIVAQATVSFAYALVDLAALSFLGFNIQPPTADWGVMVSAQDAILEGHYLVAIYPGIAIVLCVIAINYLGGRVSDVPVGRRGR